MHEAIDMFFWQRSKEGLFGHIDLSYKHSTFERGTSLFRLEEECRLTGLNRVWFTSVIYDGRSLSWNDIIIRFVYPIGGGNSNTLNTDSTESVPTMGWPLRNLIAYLAFHWNLGTQSITILSYRTKRYLSNDLVHDDESLLVQVVVPSKEDYGWTST
jgi:hypothetical protein